MVSDLHDVIGKRIIFIIDLSYQLFQYILQRDNSDKHMGSQRFLNNRHMLPRFLNILQNRRQLLSLCNEYRLLHHLRNDDFLILQKSIQYIAHAQNTDNLGCLIGNHRKPGQLVIMKNLLHLLIGGIVIQKNNLILGYHDIAYILIIKLNDAFNQLALFLLQNSLLFNR